jgi:SNF2 family DNA or RNA helicase
MELTATLLPHQVIGRDWCLEREEGGCVLADDMGLGKTVTSIAVMCAAAARTLIVLPLALVAQWKKEIAKHASGAGVVEYTGAKRRGLIGSEAWEMADVVLTTYGTILSDFKKGKLEYLVEGRFGRLILDEAHKVKNFKKGKTHVALRKICRDGDIPRRLFLTGTPICNSETDLISLLKLTRRRGRLDDLAREFVLYRTKEELLADKLPPISVVDVGRPLDEGSRQSHYHKWARTNLGGMPLLEILRMRQSADDTRLLPEEFREEADEEEHEVEVEDDSEKEADAGSASISSAKIAELRDIIARIPAGDKVVIFSQWVKMLECAKAVLGCESALMYHGGMTAREKARAVELFEDDEEKRFMLVSLKAGGFGLNLCMANHVVILEPYFTYADEKQAIDRVFRIGQTKPVFVHKLWAEGSIENWVRDLQERKRLLAVQLLA